MQSRVRVGKDGRKGPERRDSEVERIEESVVANDQSAHVTFPDSLVREPAGGSGGRTYQVSPAVLRRWQAAQNLHQIARETALDRKTVPRHLGAAKFCGLSRNGALEEVSRILRDASEKATAMLKQRRDKLDLLAAKLEEVETLDEAEIARVSKRVQGRPAAERTAEWRTLDGQRAQIEAWLGGERALRLRRVYTLLERKGVQVSYWMLRRYAQQELGWPS